MPGTVWSTDSVLASCGLALCDHSQLQVPQQWVLIVDQGAVHLDAFLDCGSGTPRGDPGAVGLIRDLFPDFGPGVLAVGLLEWRQQCSAFAPERHPAPEQIRVARMAAG